jgi:hypothetical protein
MLARVQLSAFSTTFIPPVDTRILQVSTDALPDQQSGQRSFPVKVSIDKAPLARLDVNTQIKAVFPARLPRGMTKAYTM